MIKYWKQVVLWGIVLYALIFVEVSAIMFIPFLQENEQLQNIIHLIVLPFFVLFVGYQYFSRAPGDLKEGLKYGFWLLIIGTILDIAVTIPLFIKSFAAFYGNYWLWLGFAEVLFFSIISGIIFRKK